MPLYEYQCEACGHRFETIQKFSDAPIDTCPKCGGKVQKQASAPAFHLKGSGWYITDYARKEAKGEAPAAGSDKGDKTDKGAKGEKADTPAKTESSTSPASTPSTPVPSKTD